VDFQNLITPLDKLSLDRVILIQVVAKGQALKLDRVDFSSAFVVNKQCELKKNHAFL
jgi:hypothetical protein